MQEGEEREGKMRNKSRWGPPRSSGYGGTEIRLEYCIVLFINHNDM